MDGTGDVPRLPDGTPIEEEELSQHLQKPEHKPSHADIHYEDASTKGERKLTAEELERFLPPGDGGVVIQAKLVLDNGEEIAARRPQPLPVKASELFAALVAFGGEGRYAYSGAGLNGWAALTCMELRSITAQSTSRRIVGSHPVIKVWEAPDLRESRGNSYPSPQEAVEQHRLGASKGNAAVTPRKSSGGVVADSSEGGDIASDMDALAFGDDFMKPSKAQSNKKVSAPTISSAGDGDQFTYLVTLRCAPWTLTGWSKDSPGCVWWYEKYSRPVALVGPHDAPGRVLCGSGMIDFVLKDGSDADPECEHVYLFHHRYALPGGRPETLKDKLTYHSALLVQWRHKGDRRSFSVIELATLNGCAGRGGKANWHEDKLEPVTKLSKAMPRRMKAPWDSTRAEVRCHDVTCESFEEFQAFVKKYTGPLGRFLDPAFTHDHQVRLSFRKKTHIMQFLLNYVGRDFRYTERHRNCQTFATDFYQFLAAKSGMTCYSSIVSYVPRVHLFLYDYTMFENPNGVLEYSTKYKKQNQ